MHETVPTVELFEALAEPAVFADPYPRYRAMREHAPIAKAPMTWVLTSYEHATRALRDPRLSSSERNHSALYAEWKAAHDGAPLMELGDAPFLIFMDPPDHTRLRGLVQQAFTPKMVQRIRPDAEAITEHLLDEALARGSTIDLVPDLAFPLPVTIIGQLLGVPAADLDEFGKWSSALARGLDPMPLRSPEVEAALLEAGTQLFAYVYDLIGRRRSSPGDDLISAMIAVEEEGERLTEIELVTTTLLLLIAGHETTMNLIGNGVLALVQHPEQLAQLRRDPSLARRAVDEMLRYDAPVQFTQRIATETIELGGVTIGRGEHLAVMIGAANHDPAMFDDPDSFHIARDKAQHHLSFGGGIHHCLGAALARTEGEVAITALLRRGARIELAGEPARRPSFTLRGLTSLPLAVS
jgi:cytochrome P450